MGAPSALAQVRKYIPITIDDAAISLPIWNTFVPLAPIPFPPSVLLILCNLVQRLGMLILINFRQE